MMAKNLSSIAGVVLTVAAFIFAGGCATTVEDRIQADMETFESFPSNVQENIRAGEIKPGYTEDMVRMALGDPDRIYQRVTEEVTEEVWVYTVSRPRFSFGLGGSVGGRRSAVGTGVGVQPGGVREEKMRVIMRQGKVYAIERHGTN